MRIIEFTLVVSTLGASRRCRVGPGGAPGPFRQWPVATLPHPQLLLAQFPVAVG